MNIKDIIVGDRVLLQTSEFVKEVAQIKGINMDNGLVIVKLSNGDITEINPQYIIKTFGQ